MTKKTLKAIIEDEGNYRNVSIDSRGKVTAVRVGQPSRYNPKTNTGGRVYLGFDTEIVKDLVIAGRIDSEFADTYKGI